MNNGALVEKLVDLYINLLPNREIPYPRTMISFSGIPGSNKTNLAKRLAKDLKAQWIQHDDMRHVIAAAGYDPRGLSMVVISGFIIRKIIDEDPNKCIILDLSIDRTWERFRDYCKTNSIKPIVIRLNVPLDVLRERLAAREGTSYFDADKFEEYVMDFETSKKHIKADFELDQNYEYAALLTGIKELIG